MEPPATASRYDYDVYVRTYIYPPAAVKLRMYRTKLEREEILPERRKRRERTKDIRGETAG
jgi:hypothetical protein